MNISSLTISQGGQAVATRRGKAHWSISGRAHGLLRFARQHRGSTASAALLGLSLVNARQQRSRRPIREVARALPCATPSGRRERLPLPADPILQDLRGGVFSFNLLGLEKPFLRRANRWFFTNDRPQRFSHAAIDLGVAALASLPPACGISPLFGEQGQPAAAFLLPVDLFLGYPDLMTKSNRDIPKKKRGPPSQGGRKPPQLVRMEDSLTSAIDKWRAKQDDELSRPEAIRRLVELGLKATK